MKITWNELTVNFNNQKNDLLSDWHWLIGDAKPILITSLGDAFLQGKEGDVYWLSVGDGKINRVSSSYEEFKEQMVEKVDVWFISELVADLIKSGASLKEGECFGFKKPPILGGKYEVLNFEPIDISIHFSILGQIHEQVKDLPDGTTIDNIKFQ